MTAAVCNRFHFSPYIFSSSLQRVRGNSGGFIGKIVRLKHSISQPSVVPDVFFLYVQRYWLQRWRHCIRHPLPPCVTASFTQLRKISQIYLRTRMAHRSLDRFRCGCGICGLRSVVQPSTYRRRARGPAPTHRVEIASRRPFHPSVDNNKHADRGSTEIDRLCT